VTAPRPRSPFEQDVVDGEREGPLSELHTPEVNSITGGYLAESFFPEYQGLRDQLMEILDDEDLGLRLGGDTASLGELCREIGEIERTYVESFRTFRQDFSYRNPDPALDDSVAALQAWFAELDQDLMAAVAALSEDDIASRRIIRGDFDEEYFSPLPKVQLDVYREALLIFYGKASVYLRAIGRPLPDQWRGWIG
jgi:hypothetical protein